MTVYAVSNEAGVTCCFSMCDMMGTASDTCGVCPIPKHAEGCNSRFFEQHPAVFELLHASSHTHGLF